jgi:hypothetical protein
MCELTSEQAEVVTAAHEERSRANVGQDRMVLP